MIKKRLVGLLSHAKKYIGFQVFWQWFALIAQMTAVFSIAELLERVLYGLSDAADGPCTSGLHRSAFCL